MASRVIVEEKLAACGLLLAPMLHCSSRVLWGKTPRKLVFFLLFFGICVVFFRLAFFHMQNSDIITALHCKRGVHLPASRFFPVFSAPVEDKL